MPNKIDLRHPLVRRLHALQVKNARHAAGLKKMEEQITNEAIRREQGYEPTGNSVENMERQFEKSLPKWLRPGNVGEINDVFWPFFFTFDQVILPPQSSVSSVLTVTKEAGFIWINMIKSIFSKDPETMYLTWINPDDETAAGKTPGLKWSLRDANSTRQFSNIPIDMDHVALPRFPTTHPKPQYFMPNANVEITYFNTHATNYYVAFMTLQGYRIRQPEDLLSLVD